MLYSDKTLVYIAAPFNRQEEARRVRSILEAKGYESTARWIDMHSGPSYTPGGADNANQANEDLDDLAAADLLVVLNDPAYPSTTGGMHIEFGYALCAGLGIIVVGPPSTVFHDLGEDEVRIVATAEEIPVGL